LVFAFVFAFAFAFALALALAFALAVAVAVAFLAVIPQESASRPHRHHPIHHPNAPSTRS